MTIAFPCEQCGNRFEVDQALAGKKCRCKKCGHVFIIPTPRASTAAPSPKPSLKTFDAPGSTSSSGTQTAPRPKPKPKPEPEPTPTFVPNFFDDAEDDPYAIGDGGLPSRRNSAAVDDAPLPGRGAVGAEKPKKKKKKKWSEDGESTDLPVWAYLIVIGLFVAFYASAFFNENASLFIRCNQINLVIGGIGYLATIVLAFVRLGVSGLWLFVPIGNLVYMWRNYNILRPCINIYLSTVLVSAFVGGIVGGASANMDPLKKQRWALALNGMQRGNAADSGAAFRRDLARAIAPEAVAPNMVPAPPGVPRPSGPPPSQALADFAQATSNPRPRRNESQSIDDFLNDLKSDDNNRRRQALGKLARTPLDDAKRAAVAQALEPFLREPDEWARRDAVKALAVWGGPENTTALVKALKDPDIFTQGEALKTIKALRDPAAAEPVAALISEHRTRGPAIEALKAMGSEAEPALLPYLNDGDVFVRMDVCKALQTIGTEACVPGLYELIRRTNNRGLDANAARDALQRLDPNGEALRDYRMKSAKDAKAARDARLKGRSGSSARPAP